MIQTLKILHKIDYVDPETWFVRVDECHQTTWSAVGVSNEEESMQRMNLMKPNSRGDVRKNFFTTFTGAAGGFSVFPDMILKKY